MCISFGISAEKFDSAYASLRMTRAAQMPMAKGGVTEKIVGRWLAAAVTNAYNQTIRREMNPRPTSKTAN